MAHLALPQASSQRLAMFDAFGNQLSEGLSCQQYRYHAMNQRNFPAVQTRGWRRKNRSFLSSLFLPLPFPLFPSLPSSPLPSQPILSVFSVYRGKWYSQEEKVTLCLPLHSPPCIWNIPAQTIHGSDSLGEMRFYNSGNQGDPLLPRWTRLLRPPDTSSHALNYVPPFLKTLSSTRCHSTHPSSRGSRVSPRSAV